MTFGKAAALPQPMSKSQPAGDVKVHSWGKDNLYPNFLVNLYLESPLHGGIVNGKVHFISAGGLRYTGIDAPKWDVIWENYESDFNLDEIATELSRDGELFNAMAVVGRKRAGGGYILKHINFEGLRLVEGSPTRWAYCDDWSDFKKAKEPKIYEEYQGGQEQDEFIYVWMSSSKTPKDRLTHGGKLVSSPYPNAPYSSGIRAILTDVSIQNFDYNEVKNNFTGGTHMHFSDGVPDPEEKKDIEQEIEDKTSGDENAGFTLLTFSDGDSRKPVTVTPLMGNNQPDRYINKSKRVEDSILQAHSVTSGLLFGIKTAGQLGGSDELDIAYNIMKANYFATKQRIISDFFKSLFQELYGLRGEVGVNEFKVGEAGEKKPQLPTEPDVNSTFAKFGRHRSMFKVIENDVVVDPDAAAENEAVLLARHSFQINDLEKQVLALILENNDYGSIMAAMDLTDDELAGVYERLIEEGMIDSDTGKPTERGMRESVPNIEVLYSYELRPGVSGPDVLPNGRTRPFCQQLLELNRFYTREEIDRISQLAGRNVWLFKGGWYHDPKTGKNMPYCRHTWVQNLVEL